MHSGQHASPAIGRRRRRVAAGERRPLLLLLPLVHASPSSSPAPFAPTSSSRVAATIRDDEAPRPQAPAQHRSGSEAFERTWNRAARQVVDGLWSAIVNANANADADASLLPLYADAHLALLRDVEGTARQAWFRHPDQAWRAAGRRVAQDAAAAQARRLLGVVGRRPAPHQLVRRALEQLSDGDHRSLLRRSLMEQFDFRIAGALAAEAEAEAAKPAPAPAAAAPGQRRGQTKKTRLQQEAEEEQARGGGGMWRAAFELQRQEQPPLNRERDDDPRRELLLALHAARRGEAAAVASAAAGGGGPPMVELEGAELVQAANAVPGLAPYLLMLPPEKEGEGPHQHQHQHHQRALLVLARPAVRRCLLLGADQALRRLAYDRGLAPAVEAAAAVLSEVWRWRAEAARCVARLEEQEAGGAAAAASASLPDAPRRLSSDPLAFLFELLEEVRPAADAEATPAVGAAPEDVEYLLRRRREQEEKEEEQGGDNTDDLARILAPHLCLGGVLRGLARASAELLGVEICELPAGPHPDRPPDLPDHCPALAVAVPAGWPLGRGSGSPRGGLRAAGVIALDPCSPAEGGGYGTRVVRLRFPAASCAEGGPDGLVPSPEHAVVAIGLALEAAAVAGSSSSSGFRGEGSGDGDGGGPLPVDDPSSFSPLATAGAGRSAALRVQDVEDEVLPPSALWELAHEFGHALHLLLSNAVAAEAAEADDGNSDNAPSTSSSSSLSFAGTPLEGAGTHHLAGRFLPSDALEVPSHLFERLMLEPAFLSRVCLAEDATATTIKGNGGSSSNGGGGTPLAAASARRLARRLRRDYASALAVQDRALAAVAEQLCVLNAFHGGGSGGGAGDEWASARASASSLGCGRGEEREGEGEGEGSPFVATLRQVAMLPVVARHRGTYYSYSLGWAAASALGDEALAPLVRALFAAEADDEDDDAAAADSVAVDSMRARLCAAMSAHAGLPLDELARCLGLEAAAAAAAAAAPRLLRTNQ